MNLIYMNCVYSDTDGDEATDILLPKHMRCAAHTLNLVATTDANKALQQDAVYKKNYRLAFGKAQELWNKQSRCANQTL